MPKSSGDVFSHPAPQNAQERPKTVLFQHTDLLRSLFFGAQESHLFGARCRDRNAFVYELHSVGARQNEIAGRQLRATTKKRPDDVSETSRLIKLRESGVH